MENNEMNVQSNETIEPVVKQKSNKGLVVVIILLILIVLGLSGYLVYDKFIAKEETQTKEESKVDTTSNDNNTSSDQTNSNTQTKVETDEEKIKRLFINNFLLTMEDSESARTQNLDYELIDYRIDEVEILTGEVRQSVLDMGYKETDILATVTYSVKVPNVNTSAWNAGNGEGYDGQWILRKSNCIMMRDGKLTVTGTSF